MANSEDNDDSRGNLFVNDGSFMEMFRRLQEQQKHPVNQSVQEREKEDGSSAKSATSASEATNRRGESRQRTPQLTGKACNEKERTKEEEEWEKTGVKKYPPQTKPSQGVMLGKRKSLMKSIELREKRKRRREEMEEQQLAQEEDDKDKSSAWKAYMAQVKAYEARSCTDEDSHRRPLVK